MKTSLTLLFALIVATTLRAQVTEFSVEKKAAIVDNLTIGIKSENIGLHTSSAFVMYDLIRESYLQSNDASKAMIPLLKTLNDGKTDEERIAAAFALYQLGNPIGIYQLRGVAVFSDNERVSEICKNLYVTYHKLNGTEYLINL